MPRTGRTTLKEPEMILEQLSARTRVFLLVNHRMGVFERVVKAPPHEEIEANVLRLARAAALLEIPVIFTTSEEGGENGELLPSLQQLLPDAYADWVDRHGIIDSLANPAVVDVLAATGRRQLITAGIGTEVCEVAPHCTPTATAAMSRLWPMHAARRPHSCTTSRCGGWPRLASH